jgi:hypothetical protein
MAQRRLLASSLAFVDFLILFSVVSPCFIHGDLFSD